MSESFRLQHTDYLPEIKKNLYWEVVVSEDKVMVIQRGGPLEPTVLTVERGSEGKFEVSDWWGWGEG